MTATVNASLCEEHVPIEWKLADLVPPDRCYSLSSGCLSNSASSTSGHQTWGFVDFRSAVHRRTPTTPSYDAVSVVHRRSASLSCRGHVLRQPSERSVWQLRTSGTHYYRMTFVTPMFCAKLKTPFYCCILIRNIPTSAPLYWLLVDPIGAI